MPRVKRIPDLSHQETRTNQVSVVTTESHGGSPWLTPRVLTIVCLLAMVAAPAGALPRGKHPPRQTAADTPALGADLVRATQPSFDQFVDRPGPACRPQRRTLLYHGGALVKNPDVFILFWGSAWNTDAEHQSAKSALVSMYQDIGSSGFACAWREYAVPVYPLGPGSYNGSYVIDADPPSPLDDATIQQMILDEIAAGHAPSRTDDRVYIVVPKKGVPVRASDGSTGCGGSNFIFCGYHDSFGVPGTPVRYAVLPYPCTDGNFTCFVDPTEVPGTSLQVTGSHELTELVTDPDAPPVGLSGWIAGTGDENADICAAGQCIDTVTAGAQTFAVNPAWSNLAKGCVTTVACSPPALACTDAAPGTCVTGTSTTAACEFEWLVDPNLVLVEKTQLPGRTVSCADGQPFCDADGTADGQCTFRVAACLNNADPRLACAVAAVDSLTLTKPLPTSTDPANQANANTLLAALTAVDPGSMGSRVGNRVTYGLPAATPNVCTDYLNIVVPVRRTRRLAVRLQTSAGTAANRLTLRCAAALP